MNHLNNHICSFPFNCCCSLSMYSENESSRFCPRRLQPDDEHVWKHAVRSDYSHQPVGSEPRQRCTHSVFAQPVAVSEQHDRLSEHGEDWGPAGRPAGVGQQSNSFILSTTAVPGFGWWSLQLCTVSWSRLLMSTWSERSLNVSWSDVLITRSRFTWAVCQCWMLSAVFCRGLLNLLDLYISTDTVGWHPPQLLLFLKQLVVPMNWFPLLSMNFCLVDILEGPACVDGDQGVVEKGQSRRVCASWVCVRTC